MAFITLRRLYNSVDMMQSMNGIICWYHLLCFENNMTKKSNLMIHDNSGIDYSRMLSFVFGFLVYWKIEPNFRSSGNTWFTTWLQSGHVKVVKKTIFLGFITIYDVSTVVFNWKIAEILFVSVIDYC